ncbi:MAG: molybdopterin molybdenumtransferase MoeA, partial [Akkermansiaceae bacterium]|nr:molybdopterin molybdenumtransferase MoeA [Akkermansiaceae bacterium]
EAGADRILTIAGIHAAGDPDPPPLPEGSCWEVMTGAGLPPECDTVVPYEDITRLDDGRVAFPATAAHPGRFIHRVGSDFAAGDILAPAFKPIDSRVAAVAATIGAT